MDKGLCYRTLAQAYEQREAWIISEKLKAQFQEEVEHHFSQLPIEIVWISDEQCSQPFHSVDEMREDYLKRGQLLMLSEECSELGRDLYSKHRAVHDWHGHIAGSNPFGGEGESHAFLVHTHQYSPEVLPIVFSDVVLGNCYWQHYKKPWGAEKWVYAPDLMPLVEKAFGHH